MALFNKTSKAIDDIQAQIEQFKTVFDSYVSNGNFYAINKKLEQYEELRNIPPINGLNEEQNIDDIDANILGSVKPFIPGKIFMFWNYCQYFNNIIQYEVDDPDIWIELIRMQNIAFWNGQAGMYYNPVQKEWRAVALWDVEYDHNHKFKSAKIAYEYNYDQQIMREEYRPDNLITVDNPDHLVMYSFKSNGYSAWIWLKEMIEIQMQLLKQVIVCSLINNKIIEIQQDKKTDNVKSLLENFIKPLKFWYIKRRLASLDSSIKVVENVDGLIEVTSKYLEIYDGMLDAYYHLFGIRNNVDYKKERNVSSEVQASQSFFDRMENEYLKMFKIFAKDFKNKAHIEIKLKEENDDVRQSQNPNEANKRELSNQPNNPK